MLKGIFQALGTKRSNRLTAYPHCKENPIYVFLGKELRGLSPNFHIHVSVSDLYIPTIDLPVLLQEDMC
jgi:hypothetical protein